MNNSLKENFKNLLRYFPPTLIILMLGSFSYFAWNYKLIVDDFQFQSLMKEKTVLDAANYLYDGFNGRMASHLFLCSIFKIFRGAENLFFIYQFLMLGGFLVALARFLKSYLETFRNKLLTTKEALFYSAFITAILFFFFFAGRVELWFWISATGVYLISLIIALLAFAMLLNKYQNWKTILRSSLLFFLAGGFSESFAVMYLLILSTLFLFSLKKDSILKKQLLAIGLGMLGIIAALLFNVLSSGIHNRLGWLPSFHLPQAFRNTIHSLAFPILRLKHLPFGIALLVLFLGYAHFHFPKKTFPKYIFLKQGMFVLLFISISFFIPTYLLSDIVPDRAASLGYLAGILFLFDYFIFRSDGFPQNKKSPLKNST